jgi:prepilin-type N-terminal cleavage/methylation domain-containing protein
MNKSFTLIEILVVIVVIGVLSAFILVGMSSISSKANIAKNQAFMNSLDNSLLLSRISYWKLDDATTTDSWGTYTGTVTGATLLDSGCVSGKCMSFNGTTNYIDLGSYTILPALQFGTGSFTIGAWVKTSASGRVIDIYSCQQDIYLVVASNKANFTVRHNTAISAISTSTVNNNVWHSLVGVRNGDEVAIYIDGIKETSLSGALNFSVPYSSNQARWRIGTSNACGDPYTLSSVYGGYIDDVRIYGAAISSSEIQQNYFVGINKLFKNSGITFNEFNQRLVELKNNIANK